MFFEKINKSGIERLTTTTTKKKHGAEAADGLKRIGCAQRRGRGELWAQDGGRLRRRRRRPRGTAGELRHTWLPNHAVFLRLQEGRENQGSAETEKPASSLPSSPPLPPQSLTRNLLSGLAESSFCGTQKTPS